MSNVEDNELREALSEYVGDDAVLFDGCDAAIIGYGRSWANSEDIVVYSYAKLVKVFMDRDGMSYDDACEWVGRNTACTYAGPKTPFIMYDIEELW